jgi:hypothetical protein
MFENEKVVDNVKTKHEVQQHVRWEVQANCPWTCIVHTWDNSHIHCISINSPILKPLPFA